MGHAAEHHGGRVMWRALPPELLAAHLGKMLNEREKD
jgi:hypothetical protein